MWSIIRQDDYPIDFRRAALSVFPDASGLNVLPNVILETADVLEDRVMTDTQHELACEADVACSIRSSNITDDHYQHATRLHHSLNLDDSSLNKIQPAS